MSKCQEEAQARFESHFGEVSVPEAVTTGSAPWSDEYSVPIARALAQNGVTGAAIFEHCPDDRGMHFVRCKSEPDAEWSCYWVRPSVTRSDPGQAVRMSSDIGARIGQDFGVRVVE